MKLKRSPPDVRCTPKSRYRRALVPCPLWIESRNQRMSAFVPLAGVRMPTFVPFGEGCVSGEAIDMPRSISRVVGMARRKSDPSYRGRAVRCERTARVKFLVLPSFSLTACIFPAKAKLQTLAVTRRARDASGNVRYPPILPVNADIPTGQSCADTDTKVQNCPVIIFLPKSIRPTSADL